MYLLCWYIVIIISVHHIYMMYADGFLWVHVCVSIAPACVGTMLLPLKIWKEPGNEYPAVFRLGRWPWVSSGVWGWAILLSLDHSILMWIRMAPSNPHMAVIFSSKIGIDPLHTITMGCSAMAILLRALQPACYLGSTMGKRQHLLRSLGLQTFRRAPRGPVGGPF